MTRDTDHCHPFPQCRNGYLAANDDDCDHVHVPVGIALHEQYQHDRHHELVSHRVEELTEARTQIVVPGDVAIDEIRDRSKAENKARNRARIRHGAVKTDDNDGNRCDANQR